MILFSRERQAIATLKPLLRQVPYAIPTVVLFGVITALFEGLGLSLFVPLFHLLTEGALSTSNIPLKPLWSLLFSHIPDAQIRWIAPLGILLLLTGKNGLLYLNAVLFSRFNWQISHYLRTTVFAKLLRADAQFLMTQDTGRLMSILDKETWQTTQALSALATLSISLCTILIFSIFLLLTSWQLTLLSLVLLAGISGSIQYLIRQIKQLGQQATQANVDFVSLGFEQIGGIETLRQLRRQDWAKAQFSRASATVCSSFMTLDQRMATVSPLSEFAFAVLLTALLVAAFQGQLDVSVFLTFLFMLYRLATPIKALDGARSNLVALTASVQIIADLMAAAESCAVVSGNHPLHSLGEGIEFRNVSFQYRQTDAVTLNNLSFHIKPGQTVAVVGPSGAGKSTVLSLLTRRFSPSKGEILLAGKRLETYDIDQWRQCFSLVSQNIYLFNTSVRHNIAYGSPSPVSEAAVIHAAKQANAHHFILDLPQGYDTPIGEGGFRLSGGQRQRLALARALVNPSQLLILDEATNALDNLAETLIQETLAALRKTQTVVVVAHRLSSIYNADHVLVMDRGCLVEQGTVHQLLAQDGLFSRMYGRSASTHLQNVQ